MTSNTRSRKAGAFGAFGLGLALLLVTGTTYAAWTDDEKKAISGDTIEAGSWTIAFDEDVEWYNVENDTTGGNSGDELIPDISDFKVVPGSMIRADVTVSVDLPNSVWDGDELLAEVTSIAADGDAQPSADSPLVVVDVDTTQASLGLISITFEFPLAETDYAGQSTGKSDVDLGGLVVTLTQVRAGHADA